MPTYTEGQVIKGKNPPSECPDGFYWRKVAGLDEFKLYPRKERKAPGTGAAALAGEEDGPRLTANRVAAGIRHFMQNEEGFRRIMETANLSLKSLQNLAKWTAAVALAKEEAEKARLAAVSKANSALRDAGLMIGPDGKIQPIPTA